jgi:hypothetical protein
LDRRKKTAALNPAKAVSFAKVVLQKRWTEAEEVILCDPCEAARYAKEVLEERWLDAEPVIAQDPVAAAYYAVNVHNSRWEEAENVIAKNDEAASMYGQHVVDRWDPEMAKLSPVWLYMYADRVSCGKLPPSLHSRMLMWSFDDTMKKNGWVRKYIAGRKFKKR